MAVLVVPAAQLADPAEADQRGGAQEPLVDGRHQVRAPGDRYGCGHGAECRHGLVQRGRQRHRLRRLRCVRGQPSCPFPVSRRSGLFRRTVRVHSPDVATLAHLPTGPTRGSAKGGSVPDLRDVPVWQVFCAEGELPLFSDACTTYAFRAPGTVRPRRPRARHPGTHAPGHPGTHAPTHPGHGTPPDARRPQRSRGTAAADGPVRGQTTGGAPSIGRPRTPGRCCRGSGPSGRR